MSVLNNIRKPELEKMQERCAYCGHIREDHKLEQVKRGVLTRTECEISHCDCLRFSTGEDMGVIITE